MLKTTGYTLCCAIGWLSLLTSTSLIAAPLEPVLLVGTWQCSFEIRSDAQTLVGTAVDTYFADGTSRSDSRLSVQLHPLNLDIVYELGVTATWQLTPPDQLVETITAVPTLINSNPALEQMINLKAELLNGKTESAQIIELTQNRAVFQTSAEDHSQHEIRCTR